MLLTQDWPQVVAYSQQAPSKNVLLAFLVFLKLLLHTVKFDKHYFEPVAFHLFIHYISLPSGHTHTHIETDVTKTVGYY